MNIDNLIAILQYSYDEEIKHLEESLSEIDENFEQLPENLKDAILLIEETYPKMTTHIGYNLMILKQDLQNERIPVSDAHKMRVSEMFLATIADKKEFDNFNELIDFSQEYCSNTLEDLQIELSNKVFKKLSCQDNLPITSLKEIIDITKVLNERIVKV